MNFLSKSELKDVNVLLRCDFNVPVKDGKIIDNNKIKKSLNTIKYLLDNNNRVFILSHFGRVKCENDKEKYSLKIVYDELKRNIDLDFIEDPLNLEEGLNNSTKKCFLIENTRFTDVPIKRESVNDLELSRYWASFADVFVIDAFASMHRAHSSTAGIGKYLPTYIGFLSELEMNNLEVLIKNEEHPFVVIMGGAKVDDKIRIIESMLSKCDKLILTGGIVNTFLKVAGKNIGKSLASDDEEVIESIKRVLNKFQNKIYFTDHFVVKNSLGIFEKTIETLGNEDVILDNITNLNEIINSAKIIFLNGTCGKYEEKEFERGTLKLLNDLNNTTAKVIVGGGDTVSSVYKFGYEKVFSYLSSGGGATLEYVAYNKLKAIEWIKENGVNSWS